MKIAIVSKKSLIPARTYGGTQRDIWAEAKELKALGHSVVFIVRTGSTCPFADVLPYDPGRPLNEQIPDDVDIVHYHGNLQERLDKPNMTTVHGNGQPGEVFDINSVFVSSDHARRHGSSRYVYNGLDLETLGVPELDRPRQGVLFLAKASWSVKNLRGSRAIAAAARKRLHVIGGRGLSITGRVKYYGMVGGELKNQVINGCEALLFPVLWNEPLGLAILESLYFGLPVFGTPYGSLPELIDSERGHLSTSMSELAEAVRGADAYDRRKCHEFVADNFSARRMTEEYLKLFEQVLDGRRLNPERPKTLSSEPAKALRMRP